MNYSTKNIEDTFKDFNSSEKGLISSQVTEKLTHYGKNILREKEKLNPLKILIVQFNDPLIWILIIAAIISSIEPLLAHGTEKLNWESFADPIVIVTIIIVNAIIGFIQEFRAEKSIELLKKLAGLWCLVLRNGQEQKINAENLVPGDVILLETGNKIPADARLFEVSNFETMEAILTGESTPIIKHTGVVNKTEVAEQTNMVFSGTIATKGRAKAIVTATGMQTEIGKIAELLIRTEDEKTPLQKKMAELSKYLGMGTLIICLIVVFAGYFTGKTLSEMFLIGISLAVAAVPEGLVTVITICLALGIQRMIKKNVLIRKLASIETLGCTNVICSDKTGTLTKNEMTVTKLFVNMEVISVTGSGYIPSGVFNKESPELMMLLKIGALCNDSKFSNDNTIFGDPTEASLLVSALKAGLKKESLQTENPRIDEIPFDSQRKLMSTTHLINNENFIFTKGAPDQLISKCSKILINNQETKLTEEYKKLLLEQNNDFAQDAMRVLGFAYSKIENKPEEKNLTFVGFQAMIDPPRESTIETIKLCKAAGIRVIMITGDHKATAIAIAKQIGISGNAITGEELDKIQNLSEAIDEISIFARVNPEHKIRIVNALKEKDKVVAMTGDGVNDAPALKAAQIGICVGSGTDVAKESSKMILVNDDFASIVRTIEEGRGIYDNIKKFIRYLLSSNLSEVFIIFFAILLGFPLPLLAIQLLWINLVTDGLPALALGIEPIPSDIMNKPPRGTKEKILSKRNIFWMLAIAATMTIGTLGMFKSFSGLQHEQTIAFTVLVMFQMFNVLCCKSETKSIFKIFFNNKWLLGAILISVLLQLAVVYIPFLQKLFKTCPLPLKDWIWIIFVSSSVLWVDEIWKLVRRV